MLKKILAWLLVISTTATIAIGGTLAYLTDRDSEANVFTVGDVDITLNDEFQQESQLKPGVDIEKNVSITNEGPNDAYVWYTYAVPQGLEAGLDLSFEEGAKWSAGELIGTYKDEETGITYNVYASKYSEAISAGATTDVGLTKVAMDPAVDITTEGDAYLVQAGVPTDLNWNINDTENPVIFINAYAIQTQDFADVDAAYEAFKGQWGDMVEAGTYEVAKADTWDGTADTSWYNDTDTEFTITTAEQLAGLAKLVDDGNTFAGKTVKVGADLDLYAEDADGNRVFFEPIGDASNADFSGVFDGQGHTISNLRQDCNSKHLGLFGAVYEGTVKNFTLDGALVENNGNGYAAAVAAYTGASNFENITLKNTTVVNYNHNTAGIAAWVSNNGTTTTFDGIKIENTTTIGSWWGSYDTRVGGIVGAMNTGNYVVIKNSTVACKLDVYNDICSNYQWGNYRMAGMVVADVRDNHTVNGRTEANPVRVTCENVTVIFGDWANYHYCESESYGKPSYASEGQWKYQRVEAGLGYGGVDISACNHDTDEEHNVEAAFDGLFGARDGKGIYTINSFDGVTVIHN